MGVWTIAWRVSQHHRRTFWWGWGSFVLFFSFPVATGWLLGRGFAALDDGDVDRVLWFAAAVLVCETARMATIHFAVVTWTAAWVHMQSLLRANLLTAQVASGGPEAGQPVGSAGEAITHFRDDTEDVTMFVDGIVDLSAGLVFTVFAGIVLGATNAGAAAVLLLPLVGVAVATRTLDGRIKRYRAADREAAGAVSGFIGDVMAAATTVKVNHAIEPTMARLADLVEQRRRTAVRDRVLDDGVYSFSEGAADIGLGLVLVASAGALASGDFAVGQLAVFAAYLGYLSFLPRMVGRLLARRKQAAVAVERMSGLVARRDPVNTVRPRELPIGRRDVRVRPAVHRPPRVPLRRFEARGLTVRYLGGGGIDDVDLSIERGSFTVVTGPIGSGKSTLLRALLGLVHDAPVDGELRWNDELLVDPAAFLVPPNAAFLPQVPQLISDTLADNVALGSVEPDALHTALSLAEVATDVAELPDGTDTLIGPRGLRLSGGQRQRVATARALVHGPELVVLDDLSSALDVETELRLWDNLASAGTTVIAVSHRAVAFERADSVVTMRSGSLVP
jgi:ATP-binding cassette subfamily B protein